MVNEQKTDKRLLLLNVKDNVLVTTTKISAGQDIQVEGALVKFLTDVDVGHKVAREEIPQSTKIIKYGAPIGSSTDSIAIGEHVHTQNMKSDYISSHTRAGKTG